MCFSKNISLFTFLTGIIGGLLCYSTGIPEYKIIGLLYAFVSLMQGIEYLLWIHQTCDDYNRLLSTIGMILNHLQPVILCILLFYFKEKFNKKILLLLIIYLIVIIPYSLKFKNECTMKENTHLNWEWNHMDNAEITYAVFLITLIIFGLFIPNIGKSFSLITLISYFFSYFIYKGTVGSMWCFFSAFIPIIYYIYFTLTKIKVV